MCVCVYTKCVSRSSRVHARRETLNAARDSHRKDRVSFFVGATAKIFLHESFRGEFFATTTITEDRTRPNVLDSVS